MSAPLAPSGRYVGEAARLLLAAWPPGARLDARAAEQLARAAGARVGTTGAQVLIDDVPLARALAQLRRAGWAVREQATGTYWLTPTGRAAAAVTSAPGRAL